MKKMGYAALGAGAFLAVSIALPAFAEVKINVNIGVPVVAAPAPVVVAPAPVWAPPPGGSIYSYYYYPSVGVYFDFGRGLYFYLSGSKWVQTKTRPPVMVYDDRDFIVLDMGDNDPHRHHVNVIKSYPPVYFKEHKWDREKHGRGHGGRDRHDRDRDDDDQGGKNKGKGKHKKDD